MGRRMQNARIYGQEEGAKTRTKTSYFFAADAVASCNLDREKLPFPLPPPPSYECENAGGGFPQNPHEKNRNEWGECRGRSVYGGSVRESRKKHKFRKSFKFFDKFYETTFLRKAKLLLLRESPRGREGFPPQEE